MSAGPIRRPPPVRPVGETLPFADRRDAGRRLAQALERFRNDDPVVLGLPRGGVPVAYEVADRLHAPLDVLVARKLGVPGRPELGFGAVAPGGVRIVDGTIVDALRIREDEVDEIAAAEGAEVDRRLRAYRGTRAMPALDGRVVILVDDGVATGGTARAAIEAARLLAPARIVFAVPVAAPAAAEALRPEVDDLVVLATPTSFGAVGFWYDDFEATSDDEVRELLATSRHVEDVPRMGEVASAGEREVAISVGREALAATLHVPPDPVGAVLFAHGSGSGRFSPRNRRVADALHERGLATLLVDLLTVAEERVDLATRHFRFDVAFLTERLLRALEWAKGQAALSDLPFGLFGSSTGGAVVLRAAAIRPAQVAAVVSRGGRPDLADDLLDRVEAPTLLVVGARDEPVVAMNRLAFERLRAPKELALVPGATHLFEEPGALSAVARLSGDWFASHLGVPGETRSSAGG